MDKIFGKETEELVRNGAKFYVNLERRSLSIDGKYLIKDGKHDLPLGVSEEDFDGHDIIKCLEIRYEAYKRSVPSERSESHRRTYFKALPEKELSDADMIYGEPREFARFMLESLVLAAVMTGALKWKDEYGTWFWQSKNDRDFVILRKWVDSND